MIIWSRPKIVWSGAVVQRFVDWDVRMLCRVGQCQRDRVVWCGSFLKERRGRGFVEWRRGWVSRVVDICFGGGM
jgi:hypothetical protein